MTARSHPASPSNHRAISPWLILALAGLLTTILLAALGTQTPITSVSSTAFATLSAGLPAMAYVLGAWGLGWLARPIFARSNEAPAIQLGVGLAIMLSLSHGLGLLGLLNPVTAIATVGLGLGLGIFQLVRERSPRWRAPVASLAWIPGIALLIVASASPPGWLWGSEFGGYDSLSYHLQLPQEWIASGRIGPVEHNVYSYLPSYVESAFVHLAHMTLAPRSADGGEMHLGLLAGSGWRAQIPHYLHALFALAGAWIIRRLTILMLRDRCESDDQRAMLDTFAWFAGAVVISTPWVIVVGSMAYNEMAVVALAGAGAICAISPGLRPWSRGLLLGGLVGVACGAKPTALFLVGLPMGVLLIGSELWGLGVEHGDQESHHPQSRVRALGVVVGVGCLAGAAALAPWLIRNAMVGGNPVFPQLAEVFGSAHWSPEQVARFAGAHRFEGSMLDRLALTVLPDSSGFRGMSHPQWMLLWPAAIGGIVVAMLRRDSRRAGTLFTLALGIGLTSWLALTHIQSRFLLPLLPFAMMAIVLGGWMLHRDRRIGLRVMLALAVVQTLASGSIFFGQRGGLPNALIGVGAGYSSGAYAQGLLGDRSQSGWSDRLRGLELQGQASASAMVNLTLEPGELLYMLGDATAFYIRPPVLYHTTWDGSPLGRLVRESPNDPSQWTRGLRDLGVRYVDINFAELGRLERSGWYDPQVGPELVGRWAQTLGEPILEWPEGGRFIFDLQQADTP